MLELAEEVDRLFKNEERDIVELTEKVVEGEGRDVSELVKEVNWLVESKENVLVDLTDKVD